MSPRMYSLCGRNRQRGAIGLMAALTMGLALLCMVVVVDSGRLYLEKRKLQKVADMAALEAASRRGICSTGTATTYATESATRNNFTILANSTTLGAQCGTLGLDTTTSRRTFIADNSKSEAIKVTVTNKVPTSIAAGIGAMFGGNADANTTLTAIAVATLPLPPLAQLRIQTTLAAIDSTKSGLLNLIWGQMLGGTLNVQLVGYQGLANTDINLLKYLDQLAIDTHIKAGDYATLLASDIKVTQLLNTSLTVLPQTTPAVQLAIQTAISTLSAAVGNVSLKLQDLISLQTGTTSAALDTTLNLFNMVEAFVQLSNSENAASAVVPLSIPGVLNVTAKVKVIEPPKLSAIGNPELISTQPISVRTAQVRTLISLDIPAATIATSLVNGILNLVTGILSILGTSFDIKILPNGSKLDISLEAASATSRVTAFNCSSEETKTLDTETTTAAVKVKVGSISNGEDWNSSFSELVVKQVPLIDIGTITCGLLTGCQPRVAFGGGGVGLMIGGNGALDGSILGTTQPHTFVKPPEINATPAYFSFDSKNVVASLEQTLGSVHLTSYPATATSLLSAVLGLVTGLVSQLLSAVGSIVGGILSNLLDPILNQLLATLGVSLANVDVGANLSCHPGQAQLVI